MQIYRLFMLLTVMFIANPTLFARSYSHIKDADSETYLLRARHWENHNYGHKAKSGFIESGSANHRRSNCLVFGPYITVDPKAWFAARNKNSGRGIADIVATVRLEVVSSSRSLMLYGVKKRLNGSFGKWITNHRPRFPFSKDSEVIVNVDMVARGRNFGSRQVTGKEITAKPRQTFIRETSHNCNQWVNVSCEYHQHYKTGITLVADKNNFKFQFSARSVAQRLENLEIRICNIAPHYNVRWIGTSIKVNYYED